MHSATLSNSTKLSLIALQVLALRPVWTWYLDRMTDGSDEPWGILALGSVLAIVVLEMRTGTKDLDRHWLSASTVLTAFYTLASPFITALPRAMLGVSALGASLFALARPKGPWLALLGLLLLSLPIISSLQFYLGYPLRLLTTWGSVEILSLVRLEVTQQGTALQWQDRTVLVDAPCSGVHMLWVGLLLSGLVSYVRKATTARTAINGGLAVLAVVIGNILRATLLFFKEAEVVALPSWTHAAIGVLCFALMTTIIVLAAGRHRHAA
jgi:exosortase/archaeosortase family protein